MVGIQELKWGGGTAACQKLKFKLKKKNNYLNYKSMTLFLVFANIYVCNIIHKIHLKYLLYSCIE